MIDIVYLYRIAVAIILSLLIGWEREQQHKGAGVRTISLVTLGATLIVIVTLRWDMYKALNNSFDAIRAISYYLASLGFMGSGLIRQKNGNITGLTTASLLLPMAIVGFLCGMGEIGLAIVASVIIYFILKLKYVKFKMAKVRRKRRRKRCKRRK